MSTDILISSAAVATTWIEIGVLGERQFQATYHATLHPGVTLVEGEILYFGEELRRASSSMKVDTGQHTRNVFGTSDRIMIEAPPIRTPGTPIYRT